MFIDKEENLIHIDTPIRNYFNENEEEFYFSVVDVIDNLHLSTDPRNYWKVLKNRLKKSQNELVTECNQLKMKAIDGKYYSTDVARVGTILQLIQVLSPTKVSLFEEYFNKIELKNFLKDTNYFAGNIEQENLSTVSTDDGEIKIDMYKKDNCIYVNAMLAGVENENIFISLNTKVMTLKFNRQEKNTVEHDIEELSCGRFSKVISLPFEVDIDRVETTFNFGLLSIKLFIIDKTRTKIVKVIN